MSAGTFSWILPVLILEIVEHVGHPAREGQHDDKEGDQEHHDILHHRVDTQDDGTEIFGGNPNFYDLYDGKCEGNSPQYSACGAQSGYLRVTPEENVVNDLDDESNHEEHVHDDVVVVPEGEISLFESFLIGTGTL